jgi:hypothetical protein
MIYLECECGLRFCIGGHVSQQDQRHLEEHARTEDRVRLVEQVGPAREVSDNTLSGVPWGAVL